jgi:ribose/xylose/arabinose/galactoside ABC-type transport system permease subunit
MATANAAFRRVSIQNFLFSYGFLIIMLLVVALYSIVAPNFFKLSNFMAILQTASPLMIIAGGLALVIMTGKIDLSVGSMSFLASCVGMILIVRMDFPIIPSLFIMLASGAVLGMLNGFIVIVLRVNPLITTLGTLIMYRGIALQLINSQTLGLPESMRAIGNMKVGPVFVTILAAAAVLIVLHIVHSRTPFGKNITALGNGEEVAARLGVRVKRVTFLTFLLSGVFAALSGLVTMCQVGALSPTVGSGMEFTGVAAIIIGGISLFGGEGTIIPGLILGGCTLAVIENGLNLLSASSYAYPFVRGLVIFVAMYADSLKYRVRTRRRTVDAKAETGRR